MSQLSLLGGLFRRACGYSGSDLLPAGGGGGGREEAESFDSSVENNTYDTLHSANVVESKSCKHLIFVKKPRSSTV